jgi:2-polyprenyl-3-methyl-5-hydroxy-6-metoxy-1,4-benzoquinol methylase
MNMTQQTVVNDSYQSPQSIDEASRLVLANEHYNRSIQAGLPLEERLTDRLKSKGICLEILTQDSHHVDALNIMGRIAIDEMDYDSALILFTKCLRAHPEHVGTWVNTAYLHLICRKPENAEKCLNHALKLEPNHIKALKALAYTKHQQGNQVEAFQIYRALARQGIIDGAIQSGLSKCAPFIKAESFDAQLQADVDTFTNLQDVDPNAFSGLAISLLDSKYGLSDSDSQLDLDALANDSFLLNAISELQMASQPIEELVRSLRYCVLADSLHHTRIRDELINLAVAISLYSANNEYVMELKSDEKQSLNALKTLVQGLTEDKNWHPDDLAGAMVLITMYEPIHALENSEKLMSKPSSDWAPFMRNLVDRTLFEPAYLKKLAEQNQTLGKHATTNQDIENHYSESPYPRWTHMGFHTPIDYLQALHTELPHYQPHSHLKGKTLEVLIAGCGTGLQALRAAKYFNNIKVTAIDLSPTSVAYASMMANRLRINNIDFYQGDLLNIGQLDKEFDIIECSGVLHHMDQPETGLKALLSVLQEGGLLKLGLYSETARQGINHVRDMIQRNEVQPTLENIQQLRAMLMNNEIDGDFSSIISRPDFFNSSGCRDLLFNPVEHQYNLKKIKSMLDGHNLNFLGFIGVSAQLKEKFDQRFPLDRSRTGIQNWGQIEEQNPKMFDCMYQFYCNK